MTARMPDASLEETPEAQEPEPVLLSRDDILRAEDLPMERVDVPEWGGFVYVRTLTGAERDAYTEGCYREVGKDRKFTLRNIRARLVTLAVCNEKGDRLFTDADAISLGKKSSAALERIFQVAQRLSGFSEEDVEDLAKNSDGAPTDSDNCV